MPSVNTEEPPLANPRVQSSSVPMQEPKVNVGTAVGATAPPIPTLRQSGANLSPYPMPQGAPSVQGISNTFQGNMGARPSLSTMQNRFPNRRMSNPIRPMGGRAPSMRRPMTRFASFIEPVVPEKPIKKRKSVREIQDLIDSACKGNKCANVTKSRYSFLDFLNKSASPRPIKDFINSAVNSYINNNAPGWRAPQDTLKVSNAWCYYPKELKAKLKKKNKKAEYTDRIQALLESITKTANGPECARKKMFAAIDKQKKRKKKAEEKSTHPHEGKKEHNESKPMSWPKTIGLGAAGLGGAGLIAMLASKLMEPKVPPVDRSQLENGITRYGLDGQVESGPRLFDADASLELKPWEAHPYDHPHLYRPELYHGMQISTGLGDKSSGLRDVRTLRVRTGDAYINRLNKLAVSDSRYLQSVISGDKAATQQNCATNFLPTLEGILIYNNQPKSSIYTTKRSAVPYGGLVNSPKVPLLNPIPIQQPVQAANNDQNAVVAPPVPLVSQQVAPASRTARGYGNTPVKSQANNPQGIGRPVVGAKKTS
jgi:hypothetical protein